MANAPCIVTFVDFTDPEKPETTLCNTIEQLTAASQTKYKKGWFNIQLVGHTVATDLALSPALNVLQKKYNLPRLSVKDAIEPSTRCKVDTDPACLYVAVVVLSCAQLLDEADEPRPHQEKDEVRHEPKLSPGAPSAASVHPAPASGSHEKRSRKLVKSNTGAVADLIVKSDPESKGSRKTTLSQLLKRLSPTWQRACLFLTKDAVISVFQSNAECLFGDTLASYSIGKNQDDVLYREEDASFLMQRLFDDIIDEVPELISSYKNEILTFEEETFSSQRVNTAKEEALTQELHLYQRELQAMKQQLLPMERIFNVVMARQGSVADLVSEQCVDSLEEVLDDLKAMIDDITTVTAAAAALIELKFSLTAFRSTVSQQIIATVSTVFLPITWFAGVYGSNFAIIPELNWGLKDPGEYPGPPLGYMYLWLMMGFLACLALMFTRYLRMW